jgi:hypothetical protein
MGKHCKRLCGDRKSNELRVTNGTLLLAKKFKVIALGDQ